MRDCSARTRGDGLELDDLMMLPTPIHPMRTRTCWKMAFCPASAIFTIPLANSVSIKGQSGLDTGFMVAEVALAKQDHSWKHKRWLLVFLMQSSSRGRCWASFSLFVTLCSWL